MTILGIFPYKVKDIIFMWRGACEVRLNPCEVRLKQTLETECRGGEIEMNIGRLGNLNLHKLDLHKSGNKLSLDLHKFGNKLSLDLHKSGNELSLDLHKSGNELSLDLHINKSPK